ncbi:hypothetical protein CFOL_v3_22073 [Cephalotus follicularis]|uniref:Uncharacterized protein n=1 Tax=Cephalotus follicularis TaxID=3775 RepID=A0A1Q3CER3_CEPFO|nr:hypothetical protein CFOL_v3_22073 [Cephalotus follicularis]
MEHLSLLLSLLTLSSAATAANIHGKREGEGEDNLSPPSHCHRSENFVSFRRSGSSQKRHWICTQKRRMTRKAKPSIKRLKAEIKEMNAQQKRIKDRRRVVKRKFEQIEAKHDQLKRETKIIMQQNANTQLRLHSLSKILKARQDRDFVTATDLTQSLRELILKQNKQRHT